MKQVMNTDRSLIKNIFKETSCLSHDQLKSYLNKQVTDRDRFNIENHLIGCELCNDALEGLSITESESVTKQDLKSLKNTLNSRFMIKRSRDITWKPYLAMAAIVLLAVITVFSLLQPTSAEEVLFVKYFHPYPNTIPLLRGADTYTDMENAMIEYEVENYREAYTLLSHILTDNPNHISAIFYSGLIDLILKRTSDSVPYFERVISSGLDDHLEPATWYLGLAYLRNEKTEKAKKIFDNIAAQEGLYCEEAIDLINEMN